MSTYRSFNLNCHRLKKDFFTHLHPYYYDKGTALRFSIYLNRAIGVTKIIAPSDPLNTFKNEPPGHAQRTT